MLKDNLELLDHFAGIALNALITKMPFCDIKGELGKKVSEEEMGQIKSELTLSAYEYASYMIMARHASIEWLKENKLMPLEEEPI